MADFWVLLGTDYCGKSSVLRALTESHPGIAPVSYDSQMLPEEYSRHEGLHALLGTALQDRSGHYSQDFILSLMHVAVVYLRDRALDSSAGNTVLLDSYFYKILAKCRLLNLDTGPIAEWWESFPQPTGVVFLDSDAETAWHRSGEGVLLNSLEYYGTRATWHGFSTFQHDLRDQLLDQVGHLTLTHIPLHTDLHVTATAVARAVKE